MSDLKFSIRSACAWAPWFRHIIIVIADDDCLPAYINPYRPRLRVVRHSDFMPRQALPTFNSNTVENYIHKIPGLSRRFLYFNDDTYIGRPAPWMDFFSPNGRPINRHCTGPPDHSMAYTENMFARMMQHAITEYGMHFSRYQHNVQAFAIPIIKRYEKRFAREIRASASHRHRQHDDFNLIRFTTCFSTSEGRAHVMFTQEDVDFFAEADDVERVGRIPTVVRGRHPPKFFCINNTRPHHTHVYALLQRLLPDATEFEIPSNILQALDTKPNVIALHTRRTGRS